jgi:hypothetical protein
VVLYHVTTADNAETILRKGFHDTAEFYSSDRQMNGVWLSSRPLAKKEGIHGDVVLAVIFNLSMRELGFYELVGKKAYREWCVPGSMIRKYATVTLLDQGSEDARIANLSDLQLLQNTFGAARQIDLCVTKSIEALEESWSLMARVTRQLDRH